MYDYLDPKMTVESNFPLSDGNRRSLSGRDGVGYSGRVLQAGDTLSFIMDEPVECGRITFTSGAPSSGMFYVTDAYVVYTTADGRTVNAGELYHGELTFCPESSVKEVHVVMTGSNDGYTAVLRGLMIER